MRRRRVNTLEILTKGGWPDCKIADPPEDDDPGSGNIEDERHDPNGDLVPPEPIIGGGSGDY